MEIARTTDSASASRRLIEWRPTGIISDGSCDMSSSVVMVSDQRYRECPTLVRWARSPGDRYSTATASVAYKRQAERSPLFSRPRLRRQSGMSRPSRRSFPIGKAMLVPRRFNDVRQGGKASRRRRTKIPAASTGPAIAATALGPIVATIAPQT